jgi:hypothetical protein
MATVIQSIFIDPPIAIARLGGSTTAQFAYKWVESPNPRSNGETTIAPDWSLNVTPDGSVTPIKPTELVFRDGALIRPVCPFFELWAMVGEPGSQPSTWQEVPVTPDLLSQQGINLNSLVINVDAKNRKAARRTKDADLSYGTFQSLEVRGDQHAVMPLLGVSPPGLAATKKLIPNGRNIPLGTFQVLKSSQQPAPGIVEWSQLVDGQPLINVEIIRFRFSPAAGHFYGPPSSAQAHNPPGSQASFAPVEASRAFLNPNAKWVGFDAQLANNVTVVPADTYDGADVDQNSNPSLGVVDDTCEARIEVSLPLPNGITLSVTANVFVGPPDFAPDRRPFLSLADELNDRLQDHQNRTNALSVQQRDTWVEDLFERIYETVSLFNIDFWRERNALRLTGSRLAPTSIPNDQTRDIDPQSGSNVPRAMGGRDTLRNPLFALPSPNTDDPLPLTRHGRMRHRALADLQQLRDFVLQNKGRLQNLVRPPFVAETGEDGNGTTMKMPPFMRNSNALPLTLSAWQYELLMQWVQATEIQTIPLAIAHTAAVESAPMSETAQIRRAQVLERIRQAGL